MKKIEIAAILTMLVLVLGCAPSEEVVDITSPFIGGTAGVASDFIDLRAEIYDGGRDPFDVVVKFENIGEWRVAKEDIRVKLSGFNPAEFGKLEEDLLKSPEDDVTEKFKDPQGNIVPGAPVFVEFRELNHISAITGASLSLPIRADVCYMYGAKGVSKLCVRRDILNPEPGGICEITGTKPLFNSGSPVQFANFKESARSRDKIGFSFEITNVGGGDLFEKGTVCDRSQRKFQDRVYVKVDTNLDGLSCTGLESKGRIAEGFVTLFNGVKLVTCTQTVSTRTDFEQVVTMEIVYDYEQFKQTQILIRSSGEEALAPAE